MADAKQPTPGQEQGGKSEFNGGAPPADWRRYLRIGVWGVLAVFALLLLLLNGESVTVNLVFTKMSIPLFLALGLAMVLGAVLGGSLLYFRQRSKARRAAAQRGKKK
ncbi:MAG: LapA family protein [Actinomycetia bacterium]|nr:LapA family protein [Actinomycetes bacterium]MCH9800031.1 LapA family protein [Actinomycetes bacterium]